MPPSASFDLAALFRTIDGQRRERTLSWNALAREVGVAASTIRRYEEALDAEADGVLTMIAWTGEPPEKFVPTTTVSGEDLPSLNGGVIRIHSELIAELSTRGRRVRPGGRMTIQQLVMLAQTHERTVASLVRWSAV